MSIASSLKKANTKKSKEPIWAGPEDSGPQGGITQSLLGRFLVDRERFRLLVVEGLQPKDSFQHRMEFGNCWHLCEEVFANGGKESHWVDRLKGYCQSLCNRYPLAQEEIDKWYNVCKLQFPIYVEYWKKHKDVKERTPLLQEQVFDVPYKLPSGRVVRLRGKWDSVDLIGAGNGRGIYLQENKTKSDIDEQQIKRQMNFDLQTMLYLIALQVYQGYKVHPDVGWDIRPGGEEVCNLVDEKNKPLDILKVPILGVRYNVIRRPLSGGRGSIKRHEPSKSKPSGETKEEFFTRLKGIIDAEPEYYFMRWKVEISPADIARFERECLVPILEQLCDWWRWISVSGNDYFSPNDGCEDTIDTPSADRSIHSSIHWRYPFGVYNPLLENGSTELDEFLNSGSELGLQRTNQLFGELQ